MYMFTHSYTYASSPHSEGVLSAFSILRAGPDGRWAARESRVVLVVPWATVYDQPTLTLERRAG